MSFSLDSLVEAALSQPLYIWALAIGVLALVILMFLTLRSKRPLKLPPLKSEAAEGSQAARQLGLGLRTRLKQLVQDLRYFFGQKDDPYQVPWVLMLGDNKSGKSSLGASLVSSRRLKSLISAPVNDPGSQGWWGFEQGMLVDLDALVERSSESEVLDQIMRERPERPLDAVLLCITANDLVNSTERTLLDRGVELHEQMTRLQQRFAFTFPVYVLVTKTDELEGFDEYWAAQDPQRLDQMFGWSTPGSLESGFSAQRVTEAFTEIGTTLRKIQLDAAAEGTALEGFDKDPNRESNAPDSEKADAFFLFPKRIDQLRRPSTRFIQQIFTVNPYQANFFFRGLYFSGALEQRNAEPEESVAPQVAFVDELFSDKIFAERNLARPVAGSIWSRQEQIKRLQKQMVGVFLFLVTGLIISTYALRSHIEEIADILTVIDYEREHSNTAATGCTEFSKVSTLLSYMSTVDSGMKSVFIPASWIDNSHEEIIAEATSNSTFEDVIFAGIDCKIRDREKSLLNSKSPALVPSDLIGSITDLTGHTQSYLKEVIKLNAAVNGWNQLSGDSGANRLNMLDDLLENLYQSGLPREVWREREAVIDILNHAEINLFESQPKVYQGIGGRISALMDELDKRIRQGLDVGPQLLKSMGSGEASVNDLRQFVQWLEWIEAEWLVGGDKQSECEQIVNILSDELAQIGTMREYSEFNFRLESRFDRNYCRNLAEQKLAPLRLEPLENLILPIDGKLVGSDESEEGASATNSQRVFEVDYLLAPNWIEQKKYLEQLTQLKFMQLEGRDQFVCDSAATHWDLAALSGMQMHMDSYQQFLKAVAIQAEAERLLPGAKKLVSPDAIQPYQQIGRANLARVLNNISNGAQLTPDSRDLAVQPGASLGPVTQNRVQQISLGFQTASPQLQSLLDDYARLGMQSYAQSFAQCSQQFAYRQLEELTQLVTATRLLQPSANRAYPADKNAPFLLYSGSASSSLWLDQSVSRADQFVKYAEPYIRFLKSTRDHYGQVGQSAEQVLYWDNSYAEFHNASELGRDDGQVGNLRQFFTDISGLDQDNCSAKLLGSPQPAVGIDLYSERRHQTYLQVQELCGKYQEKVGSELYQDLLDGFDRIASRFPFAHAKQLSEASLTETRRYFLNYASQSDDLRRYVRNRSGNNKALALEILDQFDGGVQFFNSHLAIEGPPKRLELEVDYRTVNTSGSENIVRWSLTNGAQTSFFPNGENSLSWYYGDPLIVEFSWPLNSNIRPLADSNQPHMMIRDRRALFVFDGSWALQRLVARHLASGPALGTVAPRKLGFVFRVPVTLEGVTNVDTNEPFATVELHMQIKVSTTGPAGADVEVFVPGVLPREFIDQRWIK